eukprot:m.64495 g.64495  ORF g.64495 m.64495 type:complete len:187 (+) comp23438_c0_seq1:288-848(+)
MAEAKAADDERLTQLKTQNEMLTWENTKFRKENALLKFLQVKDEERIAQLESQLLALHEQVKDLLATPPTRVSRTPSSPTPPPADNTKHTPAVTPPPVVADAISDVPNTPDPEGSSPTNSAQKKKYHRQRNRERVNTNLVQEWKKDEILARAHATVSPSAVGDVDSSEANDNDKTVDEERETDGLS